MTKVTEIAEIKQAILPEAQSVYYPVLHKPPPEEPAVIEFKGESLLPADGILGIASYIGVGKSSISGALLASIINPESDTMSLKVKLSSRRPKALYIETEMSCYQNYKLLWKVYSRAYGADHIEKFKIDNRIIICSTKRCQIDQRKNLVEIILKDNPDIGLIIFDGAGDFVQDTNNLSEANLFYSWMANLSPEIAIVCTVHTNSPATTKGRGHLGSEILRRADSALLLRKLEDNVFEVTTDFEYGKNRSAGKHNVYYEYSFEQNMFVTKDGGYTASKPIAKEKINKDREMCEMMFANTGGVPLSYSFMEKFIADAKDLKPGGAKSVITQLVKNEIIRKLGTGEYELFDL